MFFILNNLLLQLLFYFFTYYFVFIKPQKLPPNIAKSTNPCANKGRFLNVYCLADYNCNNLNNKNIIKVK